MTFLSVLWAFFANYIAYRQGYYQLPKISLKLTPLIQVRDLIISFSLYLAITLLITPLFAKFFLTYLHKVNPQITSLPITFLTELQFTSMLAIFLLMQRHIFLRDATLYRRLWKDRQYGSTRPIEFDLGLGALTWILAFPVVAILKDLLEKFVEFFFDYSGYEQTAVQFIKIAANSPLALVFALLSVLVMAPFIEEFLFRGILQTHLKKQMGPKAAILLTTLLFSLFHFSPSQGIGNIPLIFSLFLLGGFLGFLYERQSSLWASIGLHMTFNAISALRILFVPEG